MRFKMLIFLVKQGTKDHLKKSSIDQMTRLNLGSDSILQAAKVKILEITSMNGLTPIQSLNKQMIWWWHNETSMDGLTSTQSSYQWVIRWWHNECSNEWHDDDTLTVSINGMKLTTTPNKKNIKG